MKSSRHSLLALVGAGMVACAPVDSGEPEAALAATEAALVNATDVLPNSEPWTARLMDDSGSDFCTGTLIDPEWVLTAAHCIKGRDKTKVFVQLGDVSRIEPEVTEQWKGVSQIITHPSFTNSPLRNDVGLLKLDSAVEINGWVQTAELSDDTPSVGTYGVGWGDMDPWGNQSEFLQKGSMTVLPNAQCGLTMVPNEFCAAGGTSPNLTTSCFGDSGGPLLTYGRRRIVGVESWTLTAGACTGQNPAGYMRVSAYKSWIIQKLGHHPRRQVRMTWSGASASGWIYLYCDATGESVWANTSVPGTEINFDCKDSWVWMACDISSEANPLRSIQAIQRQVGLGQIEVVDNLPSKKSQWYWHPAGEIGAYDCKIN
jgi:hypothetical protein